MYEKDEKIVHPIHGACRIKEICQREQGAKQVLYYSVVPFADQGMTLMIPVEKAKEMGLRKVISEQEANEMMSQMQFVPASLALEGDNKKRHSYYSLVCKSCDLMEMAGLLKELNDKEKTRGLAFSEKKVYQDVEKKLCSEIALAKAISMQEAERCVEQALFALV